MQNPLMKSLLNRRGTSFYGGRSPREDLVYGFDSFDGGRMPTNTNTLGNSVFINRDGTRTSIPGQQRTFSALDYNLNPTTYNAVYGKSKAQNVIDNTEENYLRASGLLDNQTNQTNQNTMTTGDTTPNPKKSIGQGLLDFAGSDFGGGFTEGLLRAASYSPRPISFGEALASAMSQGRAAQTQSQMMEFEKEKFEEIKAQNITNNFLRNKELDISIQKLLQPDLSNFTKTLIQAGIDPQSPKGLELLEKEFTKASTNITIDKGEGEYSKNRGKDFAAMIGKITEDSNTAQDNLLQYDAIESLLPKFQTGFGSEFIIGFQNLGKRFGFDFGFEGTSEGEALRSFMGTLTMNTLGKFKGAISDGERAFAQNINPTLSMSEDGIRVIMKINRRIFENQIKKEELALDWEQENGTLMAKNSKGETWNTFWRKWTQENPIFDKDFKAEISAAEGNVSESFRDQIQEMDIDGDGQTEKVFKLNDKFYKVEE